MNVTLKALVVAAVATMSMSGAAYADNFSGANSNLYFALMDTSTKASVLINLGKAPGFADFDSGVVSAAGYTHDWDLSTYSALVDNFSSILGESTTTWGVFTASSSVSNGAKRIIGTSSITDATLLRNPNSSAINTAANTLSNYIVSQNDAQVTYFSALSVKNPQTATVYGSKGILGGLLNVASANVDTEMGIFEYTQGATPTAKLLGNEFGITTFKFGSDYHLHLVAATVPEADALSMMMAGLGLMGLVAIRRKQQA